MRSCISCIKDRVTGECHDIKDKRSRELIAELQATVNQIAGLDGGHLATDEDIQSLQNQLNAVSELLDEVVTDTELDTIQTQIDQLRATISGLEFNAQGGGISKVAVSLEDLHSYCTNNMSRIVKLEVIIPDNCKLTGKTSTINIIPEDENNTDPLYEYIPSFARTFNKYITYGFNMFLSPAEAHYPTSENGMTTYGQYIFSSKYWHVSVGQSSIQLYYDESEVITGSEFAGINAENYNLTLDNTFSFFVYVSDPNEAPSEEFTALETSVSNLETQISTITTSVNEVIAAVNELDNTYATDQDIANLQSQIDALGESGGSDGGDSSVSSGKLVLNCEYQLFRATTLNGNGNTGGTTPSTLYPYLYNGSFQNNTFHSQLVELVTDVMNNDKSLTVKVTHTTSGMTSVMIFPAIITTSGANTYIEGLEVGTFKLSLGITNTKISYTYYGPYQASSSYPTSVTLNSFIVRD